MKNIISKMGLIQGLCLLLFIFIGTVSAFGSQNQTRVKFHVEVLTEGSGFIDVSLLNQSYFNYINQLRRLSYTNDDRHCELEVLLDANNKYKLDVHAGDGVTVRVEIETSCEVFLADQTPPVGVPWSETLSDLYVKKKIFSVTDTATYMMGLMNVRSVQNPLPAGESRIGYQNGLDWTIALGTHAGGETLGELVFKSADLDIFHYNTQYTGRTIPIAGFTGFSPGEREAWNGDVVMQYDNDLVLRQVVTNSEIFDIQRDWGFSEIKWVVTVYPVEDMAAIWNQIPDGGSYLYYIFDVSGLQAKIVYELKRVSEGCVELTETRYDGNTPVTKRTVIEGAWGSSTEYFYLANGYHTVKTTYSEYGTSLTLMRKVEVFSETMGKLEDFRKITTTISDAQGNITSKTEKHYAFGFEYEGLTYSFNPTFAHNGDDGFCYPNTYGFESFTRTYENANSWSDTVYYYDSTIPSALDNYFYYNPSCHSVHIDHIPFFYTDRKIELSVKPTVVLDNVDGLTGLPLAGVSALIRRTETELYRPDENYTGLPLKRSQTYHDQPFSKSSAYYSEHMLYSLAAQASAEDSSFTSAETTQYEYGDDLDWNKKPIQLRTLHSKGGQYLRTTFFDYGFSTEDESVQLDGADLLIQRTRTYPYTGTGAEDFDQTMVAEDISAYFRSDTSPVVANKLAYHIDASGTMEFVEYAFGWDAHEGGVYWVDYNDTYIYTKRTIKTTGTRNNVAGSVVYTTVPYVLNCGSTSANENINLYVVPGKSTQSIEYVDTNGRMLRTESRVFIDGNFTLVNWTDYSYDTYGNLTGKQYSNGQSESFEYQYSRLVKSTSIEGIVKEYTYDALGRVATELTRGKIDSAGFGTADEMISYTYDAEGRILSMTKGSGSSWVKTVSTYDWLGNILTQTVNAGSDYEQTYTHSYNMLAGTHKTIAPDGSWNEVAMYADGLMKSVTGTAVIPTVYTYGLEKPSGFTHILEFAKQATGADGKRYQINYTDYAERPVLVQKPIVGGSAVHSAVNTYSATTGQLTKVSQSGIADLYYEYDELGDLKAQWSDLNSNGVKDIAGMDQITEIESKFELLSSAIWLNKKTSQYGIDATGAPVGTKKVVSEERTQLSGYTGGVVGVRWNYDINGNSYGTITSVDKTAQQTVVQSIKPDAEMMAETYSHGGKVIQEIDFSGATKGFIYDNVGRLEQAVERTGAYAYNYWPQTGLIESVEHNGYVETTYDYDAMGRQIQVLKRVDDAGNFITQFGEYDLMGRLSRQWGSAVEPTENIYNGYGDLWKLRTYQSGAFDGATWPVGSTVYGETVYNTDAYTGLVTSRVDGQGTESHLYDALGRETKLTRPNGKTTEFIYDISGAISQRKTTEKTWTFSYTRLGSVKKVSDGTNNWENTFQTSDYSIASEKLPSGIYGAGRVLKYGYSDDEDAASGLYIGKPLSYSFDNGTAQPNVTGQSYLYDNLGRIAWTLSGGEWYYTQYKQNTNLVSWKGAYANGNYVQAQAYVWQDDRDALAYTWTQQNDQVRSVEAYTYNHLGQRTDAIKRYGTYGGYNDGNSPTLGLIAHYDYNTRGRLTNVDAYFDHNATGNWNISNYGDAIPQQSFDYAYDHMGNRLSTAFDGSVNSYGTPNSTNELTTFSHSGAIGIQDRAFSTPVWVNGVTNGVTLYGDRFFQKINVTNTSAAQYTYTDVMDTDDSSYSRYSFIPKKNQPYTYDDAGNQTADGLWKYVYDSENQLIKMIMLTTPSRPASMNRKRVEFDYDFMGRRIAKRVYKNLTESSDTGGILESSLKFVYLGWELIAELDGTSLTAKRLYAWGLDKSQSRGGMGGIGGLLYAQVGTNSGYRYYPAYDGSGNIMMWSNHTNICKYRQYSPYGEDLVLNDAYMPDIPFGYQTKYQDRETGLYYFGYRYYDPNHGRFINRDPMGEAGGLNLYGYCSGDPINKSDYLGLISAVDDMQNQIDASAHGGMTGGYTWEESVEFDGKAYTTKMDSSMHGKYNDALAASEKALSVGMVSIEEAKAIATGAALGFGFARGVIERGETLVYSYVKEDEQAQGGEMGGFVAGALNAGDTNATNSLGLGFKVMTPPMLFDTGDLTGGIWEIIWTIPKGANGLIIQKINQFKDGNPVKNGAYLEAWPVIDGKVTPVNQDTYLHIQKSSGDFSGVATIIGSAEFIPGATIQSTMPTYNWIEGSNKTMGQGLLWRSNADVGVGNPTINRTMNVTYQNGVPSRIEVTF
jgi:RHS repeat-associated protein